MHNPDEIRAMLNFLPRRIGHACCFEDEEWKLLKRLKIPVGYCFISIAGYCYYAFAFGY